MTKFINRKYITKCIELILYLLHYFNLFDLFYNDKITNIISSLPKPISIALSFSTTNTLTSFFLPSNDQIICLFKNSRSSSSPNLNPIPLKLLNGIAPYNIKHSSYHPRITYFWYCPPHFQTFSYHPYH